MNQDSFLEVGSQHKVCEDFIVSGTDPCPHVILSDGCSASENSNYGAMILIQMAKRYLNLRRDKLAEIKYESMGNWIMSSAKAIANSLYLNKNCLDATLMVSYSWNGRVHVYVYGDGYIVTRSVSGFHCTEISFPSGFPYYLSYREDHARRKVYEGGGHSKMVKLESLDGNVLYIRDSKCSGSPLHYIYDLDLFDEIYVMSDGINSFVKNGEKLLVKNVLREFLDAERENRDRGTKGVFIQRRCRKALKGLRKDGWNHYDDISFGGFLCNTT